MTWPGLMLSVVSPLSSRSVATSVPARFAMLQRVSPGWTLTDRAEATEVAKAQSKTRGSRRPADIVSEDTRNPGPTYKRFFIRAVTAVPSARSNAVTDAYPDAARFSGPGGAAVEHGLKHPAGAELHHDLPVVLHLEVGGDPVDEPELQARSLPLELGRGDLGEARHGQLVPA